ncbi:MAG: GNAT family N-acetyltransferase [Planctomycetaceae bacterium]|jgi:GNAT superfamily N-acetyltransferase|nr:GNAT family N-acetyltransferase [Planctomycetaceae bacterium]
MQIVHPSEAELETMLHLAFRHLPPQEAAVRIGAVLQQHEAGTLQFDSLFLAKNGDTLVAALYAQSRPDGSVLLWVPSMPAGYSAEAFYDALEKYCCNGNKYAAVALADRNQPFDERTLLEYGRFEFLSDLVYLAVELSPQDAAYQPQQLQFISLPEIQQDTQSGTEDDTAYGTSQRLKTLVKATYADSLDFPQLMSVAPVENVLLGYKSGALFRPELWFIVRYEGRDIGVLLLTDASPEQFELTYMGLIAEVRGQGLAREIVRYAKSAAARWNKILLLTSVDEKNVPACRIYLSENLRAWDRKKVFARFY